MADTEIEPQAIHDTKRHKEIVRKELEARFQEPGPLRDVVQGLFAPLADDSFAKAVCIKTFQTPWEYVTSFGLPELRNPSVLAQHLQEQRIVFESVKTVVEILHSKPGTVEDANMKLTRAYRLLQGFPPPETYEVTHQPTVQHFPAV